jgi:hypothetical protein
MMNLIWLLCTCGVSVAGEAAVIETVLGDSEVPSEASLLRVAAMSIVAVCVHVCLDCVLRALPNFYYVLPECEVLDSNHPS